MTVEGRDPRPPWQDEAPSVGMAPQRWVLPLGIAVAVALGGLVFWQLQANRARIDQTRLTDPAPGAFPPTTAPPPPPNLAALTQPSPPPAPPAVTAPELLVPETPPAHLAAMAAADAAAAASAAESRHRAPAMVVDLSDPSRTAVAPAPTSGAGGPDAGALTRTISPAAPRESARGEDPNEQFASRFGLGAGEASGGGATMARRLANPGKTLVEGAMIPAVLETALNSDLPGYVRAVVSRDVRSFDGTAVLVPRGSRLVGQYKAGVALGQSRAFVIWTRLIRPDGVNVELAAPGSDALGRGGLEGRVDRHFLQRFGGAILLSLIGSGLQASADLNDTQVIIASTRGVSDAASVALERDLDIAPTVKVPQGAPIRVFVTKDLDFSVGGALQ